MGLGSVEQCFAHPQDGASVRWSVMAPAAEAGRRTPRVQRPGAGVGEEAGGRQEGPGDWLHPWEQHIAHRL